MKTKKLIFKRDLMLQYHTAKQKFATILLILTFAGITGNTQKIKGSQPTWWFGASGAANFNTYRGTTQMLNNSLRVPTAFHKGDGIKPYISLLTEYRPNRVWGGSCISSIVCKVSCRSKTCSSTYIGY